MPNREQVNDALIAYKKTHGHVAMRDLLKSIAGVSAISEVPETKFAAVMTACGENPSTGHFSIGRADDDFEGADEPPKSLAEIHDSAWAKFNAAGKRRE